MANILIVEDEKVTLKILKKITEKLEHTTLIAENGKIALDVLKKERVDLVLTDVEMPEMGGLELIENLRDNKKYKDIPVIIMSAVVSIKEISNYLDNGASFFLPKPVSIADLDEYIVKSLKQK